jgi:hypothetical protein
MLTAKCLSLISVGAAFVSGMTLFWAGMGVPFEKQSYKGQTTYELRVKRRQRVMTWLGIPSAVISAVTQIAAILQS